MVIVIMPATTTPRCRGEQGVGLIVAMVVMLLFLGVTGAVVPLAVTETAVQNNCFTHGGCSPLK